MGRNGFAPLFRVLSEMIEKELEFILQEGEGFKAEFKESFDSKGLAKEIIAFANASGGRIFLGVSDKGKIKKLTISNELKSRIMDVARKCDPGVNISLEKCGEILIIKVEEGENKPYRCSTGFYLRQDASSVKMTRDEIVDFVFSQGKKKFDLLVNRKCKLEKIDKELLNGFLEKAGIGEKITVRETLFNLDVADENGMLNNAAVLFFTQKPSKYQTSALYLNHSQKRNWGNWQSGEIHLLRICCTG